MKAKPKTFELVGDVDLFVPSSPSDNLAHQNAVAQNRAKYVKRRLIRKKNEFFAETH